MKKKKIFLGLCLAFIVATVLCGGVMFNYFSSSLYIGASSNYLSQFAYGETNYYLLTCAKSHSELSSSKLAGDYDYACGYIWKEGDCYYVVHSAYEQENDAVLTQSELKKRGIECEILPVNLPKIVIDYSFTPDEHNAMVEAVALFPLALRSLSDIAIGLETQVYSSGVCEEKLQKLKQNYKKTLEKFDFFFKNSNFAQILALREYLDDGLECISLISISCQELKFSATQVLDIFRNFACEITE